MSTSESEPTGKKSTTNASRSEDMESKSFQEVTEYMQTFNYHSTGLSGKVILFNFPPGPKNPYDLVFEGIYLGGESAARKPQRVLKPLQVTHVVNASYGEDGVPSNAGAYKESGLHFHGIPAIDDEEFNLLPFLRPAAHFIHQAREANGVVYVHCQYGISRSATVVLAYLMLYHHMSLMEAMRTLKEKREIFPNQGFIRQLCTLEREIQTGSSS